MRCLNIGSLPFGRLLSSQLWSRRANRSVRDWIANSVTPAITDFCFPAARTFPGRWQTRLELSRCKRASHPAYFPISKGVRMKVTLTAWHESATCGWCEKDKPCVATSFDDGFLQNVELCFACLQQTLKVRSRQEDASGDCKPDRTTRQ